MTLSIEDRLAALEKRASSDTRLADGVERLSGETNSLNAILTKVDDNQQRLAVLDQNLGTMQKIVVPRQEMQDAQDGLRQRIVVTSILLLVVVTFVSAGLLTYESIQTENNIHACRERNESGENIRLYIEEQKKVVAAREQPEDLKIAEIRALERLDDSFVTVDCNNDGVRE